MVKEGEIWRNKETGEYVYIKEVTHRDNLYVAYVVTSGDCSYKADAYRTTSRQSFSGTEFLKKYTISTDSAVNMEVVKSLERWMKIKIDALKGSVTLTVVNPDDDIYGKCTYCEHFSKKYWEDPCADCPLKKRGVCGTYDKDILYYRIRNRLFLRNYSRETIALIDEMIAAIEEDLYTEW
ncbi:MAG: hypothetical protein N2V78_09180 [Methanophagales archaeon]|nr:hypothetical protein [Methanophagales archaeon]